MATQIEIYNGAAIHLGKDPTFSDPAKVASANPTGQALAAAWPLVLPAAVRAHYWAFARGRVKVAPAEYVPAFGWSTSYERPSDCLRPWDINFQPRVKPEPFEVEGSYILANTTGTINLRYIRKILDPARFDADFTLYYTNELARFCALKVTGSASLEERLADAGEQMLRLARSIDAQAREEEEDDQPSGMLEHRDRYV